MKFTEEKFERAFTELLVQEVSLRDFREEIYKWAAVYASRINSSIDKECGSNQGKISNIKMLHNFTSTYTTSYQLH